MPAACLLLLLAPADVIAAATPADHPPPASLDHGAARSGPGPSVGLIDWLTIVGACLVVLVGIRRRWYRLDRAPARPAAFSPPVGVVLFVAMVALGQAGTAIASLRGVPVEAASESLPARVTLTLGSYLAQLVAVLVFAVLCGRAAPPSPDQRRGPVAAALLGVPLMAAVWLVVATVSIGATLAREAITGEAADPVAHDTLRLIMASPRDEWFALAVGMVVLGAPLLEEVMYRGLLQQSARYLGYGPWTAILATSAVFALMHLPVIPLHAVPSLFVLSLAFGWAYERTGRLATPIVMHVVFNATNIVLATSGAGG